MTISVVDVAACRGGSSMMVDRSSVSADPCAEIPHARASGMQAVLQPAEDSAPLKMGMSDVVVAGSSHVRVHDRSSINT